MRKEFIFRCLASAHRIVKGQETSEIYDNPVVPNFRAPVSCTRYLLNALKAGRRVISDASVFLVLLVRYFSQIVPSVTGTLPVFVIHHGWPNAVHVKPSEPMFKVRPAIDPDLSIAIRRATMEETGSVAWPHATADTGRSRHIPSEDSRRWIVEKKFAQTLRRKIRSSHDAVVSLIGQRPAGVISTAPASLFCACVE